MPAEDRVAAVVVAYNGGDDLITCVRSLLDQTLQGLDIIVVDNASSDVSIDRLIEEFGPRVQVIRRYANGGYAAGANSGWCVTETPIVAILNQDLVLESDCLEQMRRVMMDEPRDALVSPKLVLKSDPRRVNAVGNQVHASGVSWCHGLGTPAEDWHGVVEVASISGAAFMARRSFLEELGGLEEAYFMYMEDVDLSFRARLIGAKCLVACDAVAAHDWSLALSPRKFGLLERNRRGLWERFLGGSGGFWLALLQAELLAWTFAVLRGRKYLRAKWLAGRTPLALDLVAGSAEPIRPWLSWRHPYDILFPASRLATAAGAIADMLIRMAVAGIARFAAVSR